MSEIIQIESNGDDNRREVVVGGSDSQVSLKVYQDIYHQLTGRTEQTRRRYSSNLLVEFPELEQLHYKIKQLCDIHQIVASNEVIAVFHEKDRKDQFTSFERFRAYNSNNSSPCVSVVLKYNFSIVPSGLQKPQEYVVTIRISSRVALVEQMEKDAPAFLKGRLFSLVSENTAEISVEYADYVIARGFLEAFDEWIRGCKTSPKVAGLYALQKWSHLIRKLVPVAMVSLLGFYAFHEIAILFGKKFDFALAMRFVVVYSVGAYVVHALSGFAGALIEDAIDSFPEMSYVKINKGDERLIERYESSKKKVILKFAGGTILTIFLGVVSNWLYNLI